MKNAHRRHHARYYCIGNCTGKYLLCGFDLSSWIRVRGHYKASLLVIFLMLVQYAIEVRELPSEDISGEEESRWIKQSAQVCVSPDEWWHGADNRSDKRIILRFLLHWQIDGEIAEPNCVRDHPCERHEGMIGH